MEQLRGTPLTFIADWIGQSVYWLLWQFDYSSLISLLRTDVSLPSTISLLGVVALSIILLTSPSDLHSNGTLHESSSEIPRPSRILVNSFFAVTMMAVLAATLLALFIIWTPLHSLGLAGLQTRYLAPCIFLAAMMLPPKPLQMRKVTLDAFCIIANIALFSYAIIFFVTYF